MKEMMNTKQVGTVSEAMVLAHFLKLGWKVLMPFGDNERYDLVIDRGSGFETVQVKTGRMAEGAIVVPTCSTIGHTGSGRLMMNRSYAGEVDLLAAYEPTSGGVYLVPMESCGKKEIRLRVSPTRNGQVRKVRLASEYKI